MQSYKFVILGAVILIQAMHLVSEGPLDDEEYTTEQTEDEWHMDFMPTGYLPDSVYRELAWYGILQIQPLFHSAKHKMVAQLIYRHTLGRPHVIMESTPQATQSPGKVSRQILAEEAAKWSREQRAAQEVLMENIKSGGNGITVRTVVSHRNKTLYIIQNGNYFVCPPGSEPDLDDYRIQANMHQRKCTYNKESIPVPIDPCIEAETAPIEYSFHEGWMFCLGNGERENNYFLNGTLDCGNKIKVSVDEFLDLCAIDNNVVITFDYFGDEPRKDLMHNATLCTTWDPCRLSYLYRLEPPPVELTPSFPTTSENPCETTACAECLDGATEDTGVFMEIAASDDELPPGLVINIEDEDNTDTTETDIEANETELKNNEDEQSSSSPTSTEQDAGSNTAEGAGVETSTVEGKDPTSCKETDTDCIVNALKPILKTAATGADLPAEVEFTDGVVTIKFTKVEMNDFKKLDDTDPKTIEIASDEVIVKYKQPNVKITGTTTINDQAATPTPFSFDYEMTATITVTSKFGKSFDAGKLTLAPKTGDTACEATNVALIKPVEGDLTTAKSGDYTAPTWAEYEKYLKPTDDLKKVACEFAKKAYEAIGTILIDKAKAITKEAE